MEKQLHLNVADYIRLHYPDVIYVSDYSAGIKLTLPQAMYRKRLQFGRGFPDLVLYEPRKGFHGLAIELKREGFRVWTKDGSLVSDPHIREQAAVIDQLNALGYKARFCVGFETARAAIDAYLG